MEEVKRENSRQEQALPRDGSYSEKTRRQPEYARIVRSLVVWAGRFADAGKEPRS